MCQLNQEQPSLFPLLCSPPLSSSLPPLPGKHSKVTPLYFYSQYYILLGTDTETNIDQGVFLCWFMTTCGGPPRRSSEHPPEHPPLGL